MIEVLEYKVVRWDVSDQPRLVESLRCHRVSKVVCPPSPSSLYLDCSACFLVLSCQLCLTYSYVRNFLAHHCIPYFNFMILTFSAAHVSLDRKLAGCSRNSDRSLPSSCLGRPATRVMQHRYKTSINYTGYQFYIDHIIQ
jgi:hypothetical protein